MQLTQTPTSGTDLIAASPVVETERTHLRREENAILKEALRPGADIQAVIPADASAEELWKTLDICIKGVNLLEERLRRLHPIIGRILLIFQERPSLYKELGYETYSEFMQKGVHGVLGLHRSQAYVAKIVARDWPQVTPDRFARIGPKKIEILSKFTTGRSANAELLLDAAERMKTNELREYVVQRGFLRPGESSGRVITITTNGAIYDHYKEFFSDPRVHQKVGSKDHDQILEALMQECSSEWLAETEDVQ